MFYSWQLPSFKKGKQLNCHRYKHTPQKFLVTQSWPGKKLIEWGGVQHGPSQDRPGLKGYNFWTKGLVPVSKCWIFPLKSLATWFRAKTANPQHVVINMFAESCIMLKPRVVRSSFGWCRSLGGFALCPNPLRLWSGSPGHSARSLKLCRIDARWSPPAKTKHLKS